MYNNDIWSSQKFKQNTTGHYFLFDLFICFSKANLISEMIGHYKKSVIFYFIFKFHCSDIWHYVNCYVNQHKINQANYFHFCFANIFLTIQQLRSK